jgi:hypothetical protein
MPLQLQAQVIAPSSCGRSSTTSRLTFAPFGLTVYGLACTASWERVLPSLRFQSMLLFPSTFVSRLGSALLTFAPVRLDSSNKEKACASAHGYYDGSDCFFALPVQAPLAFSGEQRGSHKFTP